MRAFFASRSFASGDGIGLMLLLAGVLVFTGCKKKSATQGGPPPGGFAMQVVAVEAKRQPVSETLSLVGTLAANEMVEIKSESDGAVAEINFTEGQRVEQGRLLIQLDESKWTASVAEAEANFKLSQANFERSKQLFKDNLIAQQEFDLTASLFQANQASLELKKRMMKDARIHAPFAGVVGARQVSPGQVISRNMTLTWLVDLDPVKVEISVPERFLGQLSVGQAIAVRLAAYPGETFQGEVYFIAPQVDVNTRTAFIKARVKNPDFKLKPGMFANLELTLKIRDSAVVIPEMALVQLLDGERATIYTVDESSAAKATPVKLGVRLAGLVEVLEGLLGGEKVIIEGTQKIGPGAKVKLAAQGAGERGGGGVGGRQSAAGTNNARN